MFAVLFVLTLTSSADGNIDENRQKIQVAGAYNNLVRWRRNDDTDSLPDIIIIHIMGGDYQLLDPHFTEILETEENLRIQIELTNEVPMRTQAAGAFYTLVVKMIKDFGNSRTIKIGTCGSWIATEDNFPILYNFFNYINESGNKYKKAYEMVEKELGSVGTEFELKSNLKTLAKKKKISFILDETRKLITEYLERTWTEDPDYVCKSDLLDLKALVALEDNILEYMPKEDCKPRSFTEQIDLSFESALKILNNEFADEVLMEAIFKKIDIKVLSDGFKFIKEITENPLGLLATYTVKDIIMNDIKIGACENCNCKFRQKALHVINSMKRIKDILPDKVKKCKDNWFNMDIKDNFLSYIEDIPGTDDIFETFSTKMYLWFLKPFIGIPFTEMPVKLALWWMLSYLLPLDTCDQFYDVQILRDYLEVYALDTIYLEDLDAMDQCGMLPTINMDDSLAMVLMRQNMLVYEMLRKINYDDFGAIFGLSESSMTPIGYEGYLKIYFDAFRDKELSLNRIDHRSSVQKFAKMWDSSEMMVQLPGMMSRHADKANNMCGNCEMRAYQKGISQLELAAIMNHEEGVIYPLAYEKYTYTEERDKIIERDMEALSECPSEEINLITWVNSLLAILETDFMKKSGVFKKFKNYVGSVEYFESGNVEITVKSIERLKSLDMSIFVGKLEERLYESGM